MDRKEEHAITLQSAQARAAKQEYILKGPRPETHSATMPAYCYTAMCPDPELREPIWRRHRRQPSIRAAKVERICLICRKRWPAECSRKNCDCERQGHLYAIGGYNHPRIGGGAVGQGSTGAVQQSKGGISGST